MLYLHVSFSGVFLVLFPWYLRLSKADGEIQPEPFNFRAAGLPDLPQLHLSRALFVSNTGRLEIHGQPKVSWTYVAKTAGRKLDLEKPTGWQVEDEVLLTPSDPSATFEVHRIAQVGDRRRQRQWLTH